MPKIVHNAPAPLARAFLKGQTCSTADPSKGFEIWNRHALETDITFLKEKGSIVLMLDRAPSAPSIELTLGLSPSKTLFVTVNKVLARLGQGKIYRYKGNVYLDSYNPNTYFDPTQSLRIFL